MPGHSRALGSRLSAVDQTVRWDTDNLYLDSLARMQLATAAATWCNAYDAGFEDLFLARRCSADWAEVMVRARQSGARHFTFATSGSTGKRQFIRHREDVLAAEAQVWAQVLKQVTSQAHGTPISRVVVLAPTHHIYGFIWGVLLPLALGVPAVDADMAALPLLQAGDLVGGDFDTILGFNAGDALQFAASYSGQIIGQQVTFKRGTDTERNHRDVELARQLHGI